MSFNNNIWSTIDLFIRRTAIVILFTIFFPVFGIATIMGVDSAKGIDNLLGIAIFIGGGAIFYGLFYMFYWPDKVEARIPASKRVSYLVVRVPAYVVFMSGAVLVLSWCFVNF